MMTTNVQTDDTGWRFTGRHMALVIGLFFGTIITVNMVLAWFAGSTWTGLIVKNGYVASQEYNGVLADAREQAARGWTAELERRPEGFGLVLRDRDGKALSDLTVLAKIGRPAHENLDRDLVLTPVVGGDGYEGRFAFEPGEWIVAISAEAPDGVRFRKDIRLTVARSRG